MLSPQPSQRLEWVIRRHVEVVLAEWHGNQTAAAAALGISRTQLYTWLKRWAKDDGTDTVCCPHCGATRIIRAGGPGPDWYYRCLKCRSGFAG